MNILPTPFQLDPIFIRPLKIRNGSFRPLSPYENLLNNELLLVLNNKPVGYTLNFSIASNLGITGYEYDNSFIPYTAQDRQEMNDIFQLAETNGMFFIKDVKNPTFAIYFQENNSNSAFVLGYFLRNYTPNTKVGAYVVARLQGFDIPDIEANLFCYQNGQNIVELRTLNANNLEYIVQRGNELINQIQESKGFIQYLKKIKIRKVEDLMIPEPN